MRQRRARSSSSRPRPTPDRPRERLEALGPAALSDAELVALLLQNMWYR